MSVDEQIGIEATAPIDPNAGTGVHDAILGELPTGASATVSGATAPQAPAASKHGFIHNLLLIIEQNIKLLGADISEEVKFIRAKIEEL